VRFRRPAVALLALAGVLFATPAAAQTDEDQLVGRASEIEIEDDALTFVFGVDGLDPGDEVGGVRVSIAGESVESTTTPLDEVSDARQLAVLTMDVSRSMEGTKLEDAKQAATDFLDEVEVPVGLVTFSDTAERRVEPTLEHDAVEDAVDKLVTAEGTALFDGVLTAVEMAGDTGARSLILLSDGEDQDSSATVQQAADAVEASGVTLDVVALELDDEKARAALNQLATAGDGEVVAADSAELSVLFRRFAGAIASQVQVSATLPTDRPGETVAVTVDAIAAGTPVTAEFAVTVPAQTVTNADGPIPVASPEGLTLSQPWLLAALGAVFAGLAVLLGVALVATGTTRTPQNRLMRRLSFYSLSGRGARRERTVTVLGTSAVARNAVEFAGRVIERRDVESTLMRRLDTAGVPVRPAEWVVIHTAITFGVGLLLLLLTGGSLTGLVFGLLLGGLGPVGYLIVMESRRKAAFTSQLPETLQLMAGSLAAGYSMPQAIDTVVREGQQPIADELNRTLVEARLGVPIEDALESVATRMQNQDFAWAVMAIKIQREVGGNLAEVLRTVAETLREREYLRRQVRALSAEGRFSALILAALPPLFALYLLFVRPDYLALLYTDPLGIAMVLVGLMLLGFGVLWMRKIVNIEV
jgi:tight adherence protein B